MNPVLLEGGLTFSQVFTEFTSAFNTVIAFFSTNTIFLALVALPLGAFAIGCVIKAIR